MSKCSACGMEVQFITNADTQKIVPLVPFDPAFPKAHRYRTEGRKDGFGAKTFVCVRDPAGEYMSHFANCSDPKKFSGKNKRAPSG